MCYNHETTVHALPAAGSAPQFYQSLSRDQNVFSRQGEGNMISKLPLRHYCRKKILVYTVIVCVLPCIL